MVLGQSWLIGGKKYLLSSTKIEAQFLSRPARNQVPAPCELIRLPSLSIRDHVAEPYKTAQLHPWTRSYYEITVLLRFRRSSEQRRKLWMLVELSAWWVRPPARKTWQTTGKVSGNHPHTAHECADTVRIKFMRNVRTSSTIWNSYSSATRQQSSRCVKQPVVLSGFRITYLSCQKVPQPEMWYSNIFTQIKGHKKKFSKNVCTRFRYICL